MRARRGLLAALVLLVTAGPAAAQDPPQPASRPAPANVVVVMTDDQTVADMKAMPRTRRLIGRAGVTFSRSYVSYPLCCPSRATFLTGQFAHNNRVLCLYPDCGGGVGRLNTREYLPVWLERAGYVTAHIGKYLNGYGVQEPATQPRGWTEWYGLIDHSTYRMWGYKMHENGRTRTYGQPFSQSPRLYQTDVLGNKAVSFIRRRAPSEDPFFLSVAFLAPHHESAYVQRRTGQVVRPAPRHRSAYAHARLPRIAGYNERDVSDKPWFLGRWHGPLTPREHVAILARSRARRASLLAVDQAVARMVDAVRRAGELGNTLILFTSDNGFMQGEHRVPQGKMLPHDPSTHVPLLVRGPRIPAGRRSRALVANIDLAPTILDLTPATSPMRLDGRSILPFTRNPRLLSARPLLHETGGNGIWGRRRQEGAKGQQPRVPAWRAVRTNRWLYVSYKGGQQELYNLRRDRAQLRSLAADPRYRVRLRTLRRILGDLGRCSGRACRRFADPAVR